jgi:TctA family transporter
MLLIINLPLISIWVWMLRIRYTFLYPVILVFCCVGLYSLQNNIFDIYLAVFFGALGLLFYRTKCEPAPLLLGFILGPLMEENLRRAMLISRGDPSVFLTSPLSCSMLLAAIVLLALVLLPSVRRKRDEVFAEEA